MSSVPSDAASPCVVPRLSDLIPLFGGLLGASSLRRMRLTPSAGGPRISTRLCRRTGLLVVGSLAAALRSSVILRGASMVFAALVLPSCKYPSKDARGGFVLAPPID